MAPAPSPGPVLLQVLPAPADDHSARAPAPADDHSSRFAALPPEKQALALSFRPLTSPRTRHYPQLAAAILLVCTLLQLIVGAAYAANERAAVSGPTLRTGVRGLIVGLFVFFLLGSQLLFNTPTLARGGFHWRFLLSLPITLGVSVSVAFIPADGSSLGCISIFLLAYGLAYIVCQLVVVGPLLATGAHTDHQRSMGFPLTAMLVLFIGLVMGHVTLTQRYSSPLAGLLLPIGSSICRALALALLARSFHTLYYAPKQAYLALLPPLVSITPPSPVTAPPFLGDIEAIYGNTAAVAALIIGSSASIATILGAVLAPGSKAWILSLAASSLQEILYRTGTQQRVELWLATRFAAHFALQMPVHTAQTNALELVYLCSLGGAGTFAPTMAVCIGCLRAVTFGNPAAIVWLDMSPTMWHVLVAQIAFRLVVNAIVLGR